MKLKIRFPAWVLPFRKQIKYKNIAENAIDHRRLDYYAIALFIVWLLVMPLCSLRTGAQPIGGIRIGEKVPDVTLDHVINYKSATAKLSDFEGKIVILDFWATWCSPCVAMIPKMESLQQEFRDQLEFLPVTYQTEKVVRSFLLRKQKHTQANYTFPEVVSDTRLKVLFPHAALPHYVWIDAKGKVIGITGFEEVNEAGIKKALGDNAPAMAVKTDVQVPYDRDEPLFIGSNGGAAKNIIYHSLLTGYVDGITLGTYTPLKDSAGTIRIRIVDGELLSLYQLAYRDVGRFNRNRIQVKSKDSLILAYHFKGPELDWFKKYSYCYDLLLPAGIPGSGYAFFRTDLDRIFPKYEVKIDRQTRKYLALQRTSDINKVRSAGGPQVWNQDQYGLTMHYQNWKMFYWQLDDYFFQQSPLPIVDETGLKGAIDIELSANMTDLNSLNAALKNYDLQIIEKTGGLDIMVISDRFAAP